MVKKKVVKSTRSAASRSRKRAKSEDKTTLKHFLVPEHFKLSQKEKDELFKIYNITLKEMPKIFYNDPSIRHLEAKENDIIKIVRKSPTAGTTVFYRGVINE